MWKPLCWGLLWKTQYLSSWTSVFCPGRPAAQRPGGTACPFTVRDGVTYAGSTSYSLRGWRWYLDQSEWRVVEGRQAILADRFLKLPAAMEPHRTGIDVGFNDGSAEFVPGKTPFGSGYTFFDQIPVLANITSDTYHDCFDLFDSLR